MISPVVVGGVGGSGTRVVAQILRELGFYIGSDLNRALDNLWFTLLCKRPRWFNLGPETVRDEVAQSLRVFTKVMHTAEDLTLQEFRVVHSARDEIAAHGRANAGIGDGEWAHQRAETLLAAVGTADPRASWGFKEPNSHIFLPLLAEQFDGLRFVHVIRHGLDMAFSRNRQQLMNWGPLLGVNAPDDPEGFPEALLRYWLVANHRAIELGTSLLGECFMLLNFDHLCQEPHRVIGDLAAFLTVDLSPSAHRHLATLPKLPQDSGRYKKQDLDLFSLSQRTAVRQLGFVIDD